MLTDLDLLFEMNPLEMKISDFAPEEQTDHSVPRWSNPLQLQVNTTGGWKTVIKFVDDERLLSEAQTHAMRLYNADQNTMWRITTWRRTVLWQMNANTNGMWEKLI